MNKLKLSGITFKTLQITFPLTVKLEDVKLDFPEDGFLLTLQKAEFDLRLSKLFKGEFCGKSFTANNLKITYLSGNDTSQEIDDSTAFSYSIVPFIQFEYITLNEIDIGFYDKFDSTVVNSRQIQAFNLIFNDSINADGFYFSDGNVYIDYHSDINDTLITPFYLTEYIPNYRAKKILFKDLDFKVITDGFPLKIDKINCLTSSSNTKDGLHIKPHFGRSVPLQLFETFYVFSFSYFS